MGAEANRKENFKACTQELKITKGIKIHINISLKSNVKLLFTTVSKTLKKMFPFMLIINRIKNSQTC